ncbi:hypothetical protein FUA48_09965 [Flavobacterium alkalisoli]|uniref:Uncharacterized protein n=1 Tax=Flavobacterium alkalisoli TaxID=2602769 RepID=A0A5B9FYD5_9FLAO|nr:hypothetical protein FUA48_09965 [Flavobacterium alkalisoli]
MNAEKLIRYLSAIAADHRLSVWHSALLTAIGLAAVRQGRSTAVKVSRTRIMALSHIRTLPTYHKYLRELQEMDLIAYRPSYHPGVRSEVDIKRQP